MNHTFVFLLILITQSRLSRGAQPDMDYGVKTRALILYGNIFESIVKVEISYLPNIWVYCG